MASNVEAEVAGSIFGAYVADVTTGEDWIYSDHSGRNPFPIPIPPGHTVHVSATAENTGTGTQRMQLTVELIDPTGIVRASRSASGTLSPGTMMSSGLTPDLVIDKSGTWVIHALLEAEPE
jgi:hypothetical protein